MSTLPLVHRDGPDAQGIAVLTLNSPPLNTLALPLRVALADALDEVERDPQVRAVILTGAGRGFCGGGEIREFGTPAMGHQPTPPQLCLRLENLDKPVVAALHGVALGGGLELAMACHARVAVADTQVGLPESQLGLLPGAGGTQRLPRLIAPDVALQWILQGRAHPAGTARDTGLFDAVVEHPDALLPEARAVALRLAEKPAPIRTSDRAAHLPNAPAFFAAARAAVKPPGQLAPLRCIDAVEAACTRPFAEGLAVEEKAFVELVHSEASAGLRHAFFAERAAAHIEPLPEGVRPRTIERAAVIGGGTMGCGIAICLLTAGLPVVLREQDDAALQRALGTVRSHFEGAVAKGRMKPEQAVAYQNALTGTLDDTALADADVLIEAVFEDMAVKENVFRRLDAVARPGALLASNTSTLDLDRIAAFTRRPQDVVGLHFFSPAQVMPLLEVVKGRATSPEVLAAAMTLAKRIRKTGVVSGVCDGFIGNRMLEPYLRQAGFLLDEGALPQQVDRAMEAWGMAMGPFRMSDLAGHDVGAFIRRRRQAEHPELTFSRTAERVFESGRLGQKNGKGWYDHLPGEKRPRPSAEVQALIEDESARLGLTRRAISDEEIVSRLLLALVNEGAQVLDEGIAFQASDIDVVYLAGYGFPRWRGGPMFQADRMGLPGVLQAMRRWSHGPAYQDPGRFWRPAPLLERLAAQGRTLASLRTED